MTSLFPRFPLFPGSKLLSVESQAKLNKELNTHTMMQPRRSLRLVETKSLNANTIRLV